MMDSEVIALSATVGAAALGLGASSLRTRTALAGAASVIALAWLVALMVIGIHHHVAPGAVAPAAALVFIGAVLSVLGQLIWRALDDDSPRETGA